MLDNVQYLFDNLPELTITGLAIGAVYALIALGYTMVYGIIQLINFAHGEIFMVGAYGGLAMFTYVLPTAWQAQWYIALPLVLLAGAAVAVLIAVAMERFAYRPLRGAPRLAPLITAVGVSFILQNVGLAIYGPSYHTIPDVIPRTDAIEIGGVAIQWNDLAVFAVVIPLLLLLTWFVRSTRQGKSMRAVAQDTDAAAMLGIDVNRTISVTFMLAGALAAAAGLIYLLQFNMRYDTGFELGLIAFTAAVLGGIGNLPGAVLGAMVIGLIQAYNEGLDGTPGGDWTRTIVFGILIATLVFRPEGLLGERTPEGA